MAAAVVGTAAAAVAAVDAGTAAVAADATVEDAGTTDKDEVRVDPGVQSRIMRHPMNTSLAHPGNPAHNPPMARGEPTGAWNETLVDGDS
jgi:hypothetical protein